MWEGAPREALPLSTPPRLYSSRPTHTLHLQASTPTGPRTLYTSRRTGDGRRTSLANLIQSPYSDCRRSWFSLPPLGVPKTMAVESSDLLFALSWLRPRVPTTHTHTHTPRSRVGRVRGREREIEAATRERERRRRPKGLERGSYGGYTPCERLSPLDAFQCQRPRKTRAIVWCVCQEQHHLANH
jgi:hypothetical protein